MYWLVTVLLAVLGPHDLAHDPEARGIFWNLLRDARYGFAIHEEAAFLVREPDGRLAHVRWPHGAPHSARWLGPHPPRAIAIVHTHPNWIPDPSPTDIRTARDHRLPVYVVTRLRVTRTDGRAGETVMVGEWKP